jgi:hypothetical protein
MSTQLHRQSAVSVNRHGRVLRRDFLRGISAGALAAGSLSFRDQMLLSADDLRRRGMACILLWMQGGPSQFETFSPKEGDTGGGTKAIDTSVTGIAISENLPETAKVMSHICLVRSMTSREGSHPRATFLLHTGYLPNASVKYPTFGSVVAQQLGDREADLPSFVRIGNRERGGASAGFLGVDYAAFAMNSAKRSPENTRPTTSTERYQRRLEFLKDLQGDFAEGGGEQVVGDHRKLYDKAAKMILSPDMAAFDITREPAEMRAAYGESDFAAGCILARRLVEAGVPFVEVSLGNWDTHQNNAEGCKRLCGQLDQPYAQLLKDLAQRGLLEKTLVVWLGEFGRTPRINPRAGRDHYPRAFDAALAGGGVRGGQVIGETDKSGSNVKNRPVTVADLFQTFCHSLKINANHENISGVGRPVKIVEGGEVVREAFA